MKQDSLLHIIKDGVRDTCRIWREELTLVLKDEGVLIFFVIVPLIYPLLYSWI
jgi:ABC-2 type transport system permease protein